MCWCCNYTYSSAGIIIIIIFPHDFKHLILYQMFSMALSGFTIFCGYSLLPACKASLKVDQLWNVEGSWEFSEWNLTSCSGLNMANHLSPVFFCLKHPIITRIFLCSNLCSKFINDDLYYWGCIFKFLMAKSECILPSLMFLEPRKWSKLKLRHGSDRHAREFIV